MVYSRKNGNLHVTILTNDDRIDGQYLLEVSSIYIQVKRYAADSKVGRSAIQTFYVALVAVHADREVDNNF